MTNGSCGFVRRARRLFWNAKAVKLTYTPFFVHAAVEALQGTSHPQCLRRRIPDILIKKDYHIGIAVNHRQRHRAYRARHSQCRPYEHRRDGPCRGSDLATAYARTQVNSSRTTSRGGTFTVTNVGSLGSIMGTPIINQPQVGILATGAIKKRPVVIEDPVLGDTIGVRSIMIASLSYDHRVVDGAMGSSFLARFREVIESLNPGEEI